MKSSEKVQSPASQLKNVEVVTGRIGERPSHFAARFLTRELGIPTPVILIDEFALQRNLNNFSTLLPGVDLFYAVKANPHSQLLNYYSDSIAGFDAASAGEIRALKKVGVSGDRIILSHPVKDKETIREMLLYEVGIATIDSFEEIEKLGAAYAGRESKLQLCIRFRTESSGVQVDLNEKFGCRLADVCELAAYAKKFHLNVSMLAFHVGTQSLSAHNYDTGLEHCLFLAQQLKLQADCTITTFNIGGGFCDEDYALRHGKDHTSILREIGYYVAEAQAKGFKVIAEPGRGLLTSSGTLVCEVQGINRRSRVPIVHINDGIYSTLSQHTYEQRCYDILALQRQAGDTKETFDLESPLLSCRIAGRTCDSLDMLSGLYNVPSNISLDDVLLFPNISAYGSSVAAAFNGFEAPATFLFSVRDNNVQLRNKNGDVAKSLKLAA